MTEHCLRILHLTDLHERGPRETEAWRRRRVLGDAWLRNLDEIGTVDLVCFTGDLADRGQAQEYERAAEFLDGTLQRLGLARERLYLVPGNHDIDRGIGKPAWQKLREHLHHASPQAVSRWLAGGPAPFGFADDEREAVLARRDAWHGFLRDFGLPHLLPGSGPHLRLGWRQTLSLPYPVHLLGLDTAWLAGDDHDAGALRLTEDQVMRLATDADGKPLAGLRIALLHHPLDDLADGAHCRRLLAEHVDVVLRGHLHETEPTLWADPERRLAQLASGCLYEGHGGDAYPNACAVLELHVDAAGRPQRAHLRLRGWSSRGHWFDDNSLYRDTRDGRLVWWGGAASPPPPLHPRVADVFAGRTEELRQLAAALLPASGAPRPVAVCAVQGMAGVGKSYLVDRFYDRHRAGFPGGYVRLALDAQAVETDLLGRLAALVGARGGDPGAAVRAALLDGPKLLHIENVDDAERELPPVAALVRKLAGCPLVLSSRLADCGAAAGWARIRVKPLPADAALEQLRAELGDEGGVHPESGLRELAFQLGCLPLALHLAAGHLRSGWNVEDFLAALVETGYALRPADASDPLLGEQGARAVLASSFELSLAQLHRQLGEVSDHLMPGLRALGYAPSEGVGESLAAAMSGFAHTDFRRLAAKAWSLSLLERDIVDGRHRYRLHPLLAQWLRQGVDEAVVIARMQNWFGALLQQLEDGQNEKQRDVWRTILREPAALAYCLEPISNVDTVLRELDAPLRIFQEIVLPVFEDFGDVCEQMITPNNSVDTLRTCDDLKAALCTFRDNVLPAFVHFGKLHENAIPQCRMADILQAYDELMSAISIFVSNVLPALNRLGSVCLSTITQDRIINLQQARDMLCATADVFHGEVFPILKRLDDYRLMLVFTINMGLYLQKIPNAEYHQKSKSMLRQAIITAREMRILDSAKIDSVLRVVGFDLG